MNGTIIFIFFVVLLLSFVKSQKALFISFLCLLWMLSLRTNEIPDTDVYQWMYNDPIYRMEFNEPGYLLLGYVFKLLTGADFIAFSIFFSILCLSLWYWGIKRLFPKDQNIGVIFLLFLSFFGFFYFGITIRNCLSEILILCGITFYIRNKGAKRNLYFILFVLFAFSIHLSAAFFLFFLLFIKYKMSLRRYYIVLFVCFILWFLSGSTWSRGIVAEISHIPVFEKLEHYSSSMAEAPNMFSLQVLINWVISFFSLWCYRFIYPRYKSIYVCFLRINMLGLLILSLVWSIPASYRFYNMSFFFNFILIYLMIYKNKRIKNEINKTTYAIGVSVVYFAILLYSVPEMLIY